MPKPRIRQQHGGPFADIAEEPVGAGAMWQVRERHQRHVFMGQHFRMTVQPNVREPEHAALSRK